ncbi:hypothetical protein A7X67_12945 [Clostridium sp. W14A]|nr:hypothetical protein A7X67_12945 [Clostridium sp. W14A]
MRRSSSCSFISASSFLSVKNKKRFPPARDESAKLRGTTLYLYSDSLLTVPPVAAYCEWFSRTAPKGTSPVLSANVLSAGDTFSLRGRKERLLPLSQRLISVRHNITRMLSECKKNIRRSRLKQEFEENGGHSL